MSIQMLGPCRIRCLESCIAIRIVPSVPSRTFLFSSETQKHFTYQLGHHVMFDTHMQSQYLNQISILFLQSFIISLWLKTFKSSFLGYFFFLNVQYITIVNSHHVANIVVTRAG